MKIKVAPVRYIVAGIGALMSGIMYVIRPFIMHHTKSWISTRERSVRPCLMTLKIRSIIDDPPPYSGNLIKERATLRIKDLRMEDGKWYEGKYYIEEHDATTLHNDFTIVVNGKCYRMARSASPNTSKKNGYLGIFPVLGERSGWIIQPEHYINEVPNPEFIEDGYGAGTCKVIAEGGCFVMRSKSGVLHVIFENVDGVYTFAETNDNQVIMQRKHHEGRWIGKHVMKLIDHPDEFYDNDDYVFTVKKDGAAVEWEIYKNKSDNKKYLKLWSYRKDAKVEKLTGRSIQIEHTYRIAICDTPVSDDTPLAHGRGELWYDDPNGRLIVASVMNSKQYRARKIDPGLELYIHDIDTYEGVDVSGLGYADKYALMQNIHEHDSRFNMVEHAYFSADKKKMWKQSKHANATDGIVARHLHDGSKKPIKIKFLMDKENWYPATIVDFVPQKGRHGDKFAYPIVETPDGVRFQLSGKGLTHSVKQDMFNNPDDYLGLEVRYSADSHFENGKPFQPTLREIGGC